MKASSRKVILAAFVGNSLVALTKFIAAAVTGSSAMISEGIHSVVDTGNQGLLLYGLKRSARPPDKRHPFGYGQEIYFWCFVVAIMIFGVGAGFSIYEGVVHLSHPKELSRPFVNYVVLIISMVFEGGAWYFAYQGFKHQKGEKGYIEAVHRGKDPTVFVVLFEDSAALLGLAVAFLGVFLTHVTGIHIFDGLASIVIGLILAVTAAWLAFETKGLLIGESADPEVVKGIRRICVEERSVQLVNEVLTLHMGPQFIVVNMSVDFRDDLSAGAVEDAVARIDRQVKASFPRVKRVFIEAEKGKTASA